MIAVFNVDMEKRSIVTTNAVMLRGSFLLLVFNQVVIKLTNGGVHPIFSACLRSILALGVLAFWMRWKRIFIRPLKKTFCLDEFNFLLTFEFELIFLALKYFSVSRVSGLFYTMLIWLAISVHLLLIHEFLTKVRTLGAAIAMLGVIWAFLIDQLVLLQALWVILFAIIAAIL